MGHHARCAKETLGNSPPTRFGWPVIISSIELGKAKATVGENDKRYVRALKEFNNGKAALCNGRYWHAHHELWESYYIAHEILKHRR